MRKIIRWWKENVGLFVSCLLGGLFGSAFVVVYIITGDIILSVVLAGMAVISILFV